MSKAEDLLKIQTVLLISAKPVKFKELVRISKSSDKQVKEYIEEMRQQFNTEESGWWVVETKDAVQLVNNPDQAKFIEEYLKLEQMAELTSPALEALTVIAYSGPVPKLVLDRIRGVNCALILRNLLIKGLVEEITSAIGAKEYQVTMEFIKHMGLTNINELPNYSKFHNHEYIQQFLDQGNSEEEQVDVENS